MDVLSDVVALMRTGRPVSARISWRAPWAQAFPPAPGSAAFQVVLRGSCWLIPPGGGEPVPLSVGDVVFLPHGDGYALADHPATPVPPPACAPAEDRELFASAAFEGDGAETVMLCGGYQLDRGRAHPLLTGLPGVIHLPATLGRDAELRAAVELLASEIGRPRLGADTVVTSLLDMLQLYILRAWFDAQGEACAQTGWAAALADPAVSRALDAIHRDPAHRWTVESLGARAGLSRAGFARRFTGLVGLPPLAYLTWWRLATAARALRESDASVAEVAARVGYGSEFAFSAAFKREYGLPPGRYRRQVCAPAPGQAAGGF
ncbi:AraC-like DNA-binding protein [Thermocatellispora tengchongensis]|uniref:AraC-like DNA-binding protein n=1 Tax=Thermocatellispora tengchongensis TaxID=1073253 RepID=A0A840P621_9ACTN|nr:AraC family transcriptional regulator [Thermocatellispora tengchongensis]MBB5133353.1 AraC-like DNA-binding protein [Thermocatellispora tengchongensis]